MQQDDGDEQSTSAGSSVIGSDLSRSSSPQIDGMKPKKLTLSKHAKRMSQLTITTPVNATSGNWTTDAALKSSIPPESNQQLPIRERTPPQLAVQDNILQSPSNPIPQTPVSAPPKNRRMSSLASGIRLNNISTASVTAPGLASAVPPSAKSQLGSLRSTISTEMNAIAETPSPSNHARVFDFNFPNAPDDSVTSLSAVLSPCIENGEQRDKMMQTTPLSKIDEKLFLGSERDARDRDLLLKNGISHVLNVAQEAKNWFEEDATLCYKHALLNDNFEQELLDHFDDLFAFIDQARSKQATVLVHCSFGISRSPAVVIGYLMHANRWSMKVAYDYVKSIRPIICPNVGFICQLSEYERIILPSSDPSVADTIMADATQSSPMHENESIRQSQVQVIVEAATEIPVPEVEVVMSETTTATNSEEQRVRSATFGHVSHLLRATPSGHSRSYSMDATIANDDEEEAADARVSKSHENVVSTASIRLRSYHRSRRSSTTDLVNLPAQLHALLVLSGEIESTVLRLLESLGHSYFRVSSMKAARTAIQKQVFDIVLVDLFQPISSPDSKRCVQEIEAKGVMFSRIVLYNQAGREMGQLGLLGLEACNLGSPEKSLAVQTLIVKLSDQSK